MRRLTAQVWAEVGAQLGEGPAWDERTNQLTFVDIAAGRLYAADAAGELELLAELDVPLGAALPTECDGEFLLVAREGFRLLQPDGSVQPLLSVLHDRPDLRFNDAKCDPAGRCLAGTLSLRDECGQATLYRLDPGPTVTAALTPTDLSNGLGWSPDGGLMYFADTRIGRVDRIAYDTTDGTLGARRPFAELAQPDGLCVDETGAVWVASWERGEVLRFTPDGRLDTVVELPVDNATSCAFFDDLLIITTARGPSPRPHAGDLFAVATGTTAVPARCWSRS